MRFVLRMAWRETRASWTRLLFFFVCVAIGVAAIVALRSVIQNVRVTMTREARSLIGADVVVQSPREWPEDVRLRLESLLASAPVLARTEVIETTTMAQAAGETGQEAVRLVEVRAVEEAYPFYGTLTLQSGRAYSHALLANHGAIVQPEILPQLGLTVGDSLVIAGQPFQIRDVVTHDQVQRRGGFALGARVYVDLADLRATALLGFGSRASHQWLLKVADPGIDPLTQALRHAFEQQTMTAQSWRTLSDRLGESLSMAENYLSLVGFAIVVLGGIGVWSVTRVFVEQKVKSVAILKCVGATSRQVLATYVLQVSLLSAAGCMLGVGLAAIGVATIPKGVIDALGVTSASITWSASAQGAAVGLLVSLFFAIVPLLEIRRVKPLLLMRADSAPTARRRDWRSVATAAAIALAIALVAVWQAGSLRAGLYVSAGFAAITIVLHVASRGLVRAVAPLARSRRFAVRHAVLSIGRPGNQTRVILMAVGLGCFFILGVRALQSNLLEEFSLGSHGRTPPDLVLIDIQRDQTDGVRALAAAHGLPAPRMQPLMRARVVGVDGGRVHLATADEVRKHGDLAREYGITFRSALQDNERVTAGVFWTTPLPETGTAEGFESDVSIEQTLHEAHDIDVGDLIRFEIAGRIVRARVTSIRKVTWDDAENGGFVFVFRPGPIERAPHTFVGFVQGLGDPASRAAFERDILKPYPNVSAIDVREVLRSVREVTDNVSLAVTIVGGVTLVAGVLILVGAVAMTRFQRVYEAAIYRTLGAGTRVLATMVAIEYGLLGVLAGVLGAAGALALSWAVTTTLLHIVWRPSPGALAVGVVAASVLVGAVGLGASVDVLLRKPLGTLRGE
jgi:putative ABC transport system permease protein